MDAAAGRHWLLYRPRLAAARAAAPGFPAPRPCYNDATFLHWAAGAVFHRPEAGIAALSHCGSTTPAAAAVQSPIPGSFLLASKGMSLMSPMMAIACAAMLVSGNEAVSANGAAASDRLPKIAFEKYTLPNGLQVILHQDHATPIVGVNVWYHVGSKNEKPGRTGFAHLFEHMMFQGTKHYNADFFGPLQKAGGKLNGSTSSDRTNYWETVPSNYLELALWMESDRMGFLLDAMTQEKLDNQRSVVKNERRQSYENRPYGLAFETILAAAFPPDHPYSWPTIGSMVDLDAASRDDIADFFRRYYNPANASLCIAGDFQPETAKRLVEKYFGPIPASPKIEKMKPQIPTLEKAVRLRMTDRVSLPRVYMVWHTTEMFAPDDAALDVLADVLGGGKPSRLFKSLVRDKQIAQDASAYQDSEELAGMFFVVATARPGHTLAELEAAILAEIRKLQDEPPTAEEVAQAVSRREAHMVHALASVSEFGGRADRLNMYNVYTGDPGYMSKDFERYLKVEPAAVQEVAKKYLHDKLVTLSVTPGKSQKIEPDPRATAEKARVEMAKKISRERLPAAAPIAEDADRTTLPKAAAEVQFHLPPIHRRQLANGMKLLVVENHKLPLVHVHVLLPSGRASDPPQKLGLASLMAAVWDEGTKTRSSEQIADALAGMGANLSLSADWDHCVARLDTLKRHLPRALDVANDVLQNPAFPADELKREQAQALGRLMQVRDEPNALANIAVLGTLYGQSHPYGRPPYGTPASLRSIGCDDLKAFYAGHIRPEQATAIVVGDVTADEIAAALDKTLGAWKSSGDAVATAYPAPPAAKPTRIILVDKPGAAQSVISVCQLGTFRTAPDYFPLVVMNSVLGGQFSSRLNMNLREDKGYTYGARTSFDWRVHQPGTYVASASVQTAVTAPALVEFLKEFEGIAGTKPVAAEELEFNRTYLTRGYPSGFETSGGVAGQLETLVSFSLSDDYFNTVVPKINAVTAADVRRAAEAHLHLDRLAIVVVGDRAKIQAALAKLPAGKGLQTVQFDEQFRIVPAK